MGAPANHQSTDPRIRHFETGADRMSSHPLPRDTLHGVEEAGLVWIRKPPEHRTASDERTSGEYPSGPALPCNARGPCHAGTSEAGGAWQPGLAILCGNRGRSEERRVG